MLQGFTQFCCTALLLGVALAAEVIPNGGRFGHTALEVENERTLLLGGLMMSSDDPDGIQVATDAWMHLRAQGMRHAVAYSESISCLSADEWIFYRSMPWGGRSHMGAFSTDQELHAFGGFGCPATASPELLALGLDFGSGRYSVETRF